MSWQHSFSNPETPGRRATLGRLLISAVVAVATAAVAQATGPIELIAPPSGATYAVDEPIELAVSLGSGAPVERVDYLVYGSRFATATEAPFEATLDGLREGLHVLRARRVDDDGGVAYSEPVAVRVGLPTDGVLLVVGNRNVLLAGDTAVRDRLLALGYDVEVVGSELFSDDPVAAAAAVDGKALVALAQSARPSKIRDYFLDRPVPVVCWSYEMYSELGMTGTGPFQRGERPRIERLRIDAASDVLAAGLDGTVNAADEPTAFVWGSPSPEATVVATFDGEPERSAYFVYETGTAMVGGVAPARRVGLFLSQRNPEHLTHEGWMLAEVAFAWAAGFAPRPEDLPIEVAIRQPADGATVAAGTAIPVVIDARPPSAIEWVELWINGGLATTLDAPPYEVLLPPLDDGLYRLRARAVGQDRQVDSAPVAITVGDPERDVLLVVARPLDVDDQLLADRLAGLGLMPTAVAAADLDLGATASLVVLAPSLAPGDLDAVTVAALAELDVPLLVLEGDLYEGLGLVAPGDTGFAPATDTLVIDPNLRLLGGSPLAAGFNGEVMVSESPHPTRWGRPSADAVLVAGTPELGRDPVIFGYEVGDVAPLGAVAIGLMPARRVGFFVADGPLDLTADGWALFDAAALWALGFDAANRPPAVTLDDPAGGTVVSAGAPIALAATASDADGTVERVLFLANGRVIAQDDAPPFTATWSGTADGLYQLSARAVDDDGAAADSSSLRLQVGTPAVEALLVVADPANLDAIELAMADRLTTLGLGVLPVDATAINARTADPSSLADTAVVVVSSAVDASTLDAALATVDVPVATWNGEVFALLGLTASSDDGGFFELDDRIELYPLAGPLTPPGLGSPFAFTDRPANWLLGVPSEGARVGAGLGLASPGEGIPLAVFGYDVGDAMVEGTAPARRLALPLTLDNVDRFTESGSRLVDTALAWTLRHLPPAFDTTGPAVDVVSPRAITYLDPEITEDLYRVEVAFGDGGVGVDPVSVDLKLRRDGEPFFDLDQVCAVTVGGALCPMPVLPVGSFELEVIVADHAGNTTVAIRGFAVGSTTDLAPPVLTVTRPSAGPTYVADPAVVFEGTASDDDELAQVLVGGQPVLAGPGAFQHVYDLSVEGGPFDVSVLALDVVGRSTEFVATLVYDPTAPALEIFEPDTADGPLLVADAGLTVRGRVEDENLDRVEVGGTVATVDAEGFFEAVVALDPGPVDLEIRAFDLAGNETLQLIPVLRSDPARVTITSPADGALVAGNLATVSGTLDRPVEQVLVAGILAEVDGLGFNATVPLLEGGNLVTAVAVDAVGVATSASITIHRDTEPPAMAVTHPADGARISGATVVVTGVVRDYSNAGLGLPTVVVAGMPAQVTGDSFRAEVPLAAGVQTLPVVATDAAGNPSTDSVVVEGVPAVGTATIRRVSGSGQSAPVGSPLAQPLVVELLDADGQPAADRRVIFEVVSSNGRLSGGMVGNDRGQVVLSDAAGRAAVDWTLGTRAGHHDRVRATAVGFDGEVTFLADARVGAASSLVVDFGNYQTGAVGRELPWPLRVAVTDDFQNPVPGAEVRYTVTDGDGRVDGGSETIRVTGDDGRTGATLELGPVEGREGNIVLAELVSGADAPVVFLATGLVPGESLATAIAGIVLDNTDQPVPGVTLSIDHSTATAVTDAEGRFVIESVPVGYVHLVADGSTTSRPGDWPVLAFELVTVSGRLNAMDRPIYLLPLRVDEGLALGPGTGGTLTLPDIPGFALEIEPGSATFGDGGPTGVVSVAVVHADKVPMAPNYGQNPGMVLTIQPPDVHFDPPARITLPNVDALPPGAIGDIFSFRHDLGEFVAIGPASVSEDGTVMTSGEGVGIAAGGWHFTPPKPQPRPSGDGCGNCPQCKTLCFHGQCVTSGFDLYQPCDDGVDCTEGDTCRPQPSHLGGGTRCQGDKVPDSVVDRFDFKSDLVNKMSQAIDRLIGVVKPITPCKPSEFEPEASGRIETVRTCCEELGGFALAGRGSANGTLGAGLQACMIPGASLSLGEALKIGAHTNMTFQLRVQASVANDPCDGEPECPLGLKFAGTVKVAAEGGAIVQVVDPKAASAQGVFRAEFTLGVTLDCQEVDLSGTLGPLSMVVRVSLLDGFQFTHFWEIPHTRIDL